MTSPEHADTYELPAYRIDAYVPERMVEEMYDGRSLLRLLGKKVARRLPGARRSAQPPYSVVSFYGGVAVFDRLDHHKGGLAFGRDVPRVLNELGVGRCRRLFEFCAGPGYIGYSLLAAGWCETLVLSDISDDAVEAARHTAAYNRLDDRVAIYRSDALEQVPESERWDVVVANPPHFLPDPERPDDIQAFDADWDVHRRFYASVKPHMEPGGVVIFAENSAGSDPETFEEMIRAGGGRQRTVHAGTDVRGQPNGLYYQVSEW